MISFRFGHLIPEKNHIEYLHEVWLQAISVEFANFSELPAELEKLRDLANRADEVMGEGATEASSSVNSYGWQLTEVTRNVLSLVHHLTEMANAKNLGTFVEEMNHYETYYSEFAVDYLEMYGIED